MTLCFVCHGDELLLLRHPVGGRRFPGQWNGVGGHVEPGEDVCSAAHRELREEAGLELSLVPLFETVDSLRSSAEIVEALLDEPRFRRLVATRGSRLEVMVGYSDSGKDGGRYVRAGLRLPPALLLSRALC